MKDHKKEAFDLLLKQHLAQDQFCGKSDRGCPDENTLAAYLEGALPRKLRDDFERHAALCSYCQEELAVALKAPDLTRKEIALTRFGGRSGSTWWSSFFAFTWLPSLALKPALAILLVTLVSGYVGYEILQQREVAQKSPAEALQAELPKTDLGKHEVDARLRPESTADRPVGTNAVSSSDTQTPPLRTVPTVGSVRGEASPPVSQSPTFRDRGAGQDVSLAESNASEGRRDSGRLDDSVEEHDESEWNKDETFAQSSQPSEKAPKQKANVADGLEQASAAGPTPAATPSPIRQVQAKPNVSSRVISREEKLGAEKAVAGAVSLNKKVGERSNEVSAAEKELAEREPLDNEGNQDVQAQRPQLSRRIEVGGKIFELRNNIWTDTSIDGSEKEIVRIRKNSPQYSAQTRALAAFKDMFGREQDCMIKHEGRVYHVAAR